MAKTDRELLVDIICTHLKNNPEERVGQALFNLGVNQFANPAYPEKANFHLRDIYDDTDKRILDRLILR